jgi:hypothetical protein
MTTNTNEPMHELVNMDPLIFKMFLSGYGRYKLFFSMVGET